MFTSEKITVAVQCGLSLCLPARSPIAQLALYLQGLRAAGGWDDDELQEVYRRIGNFMLTLTEEEQHKMA